ncbi:MAG: TetR/AcrR family transcriptional regulator [Gammaproteobacteria bacterium]|nr:TetR/AcrR family transcriptional regulator [Gammaproteobacteria bacterium]
MPKIVDHALRRAEVIDGACDLIASQGIAGCTVRELARAVDASTGVVSHYFRNKQELLTLTYDAVNDRIRSRVEACLSRDPADVEGSLAAMLPQDAAGLRDWRVLFAYWGAAVGDEVLSGEQQRRARLARKRIRTTLELLGAEGRLAAGVDPSAEAFRLLALTQGIATQTVFDPPSWPASRQRRLLSEAVAGVLEPSPALVRSSQRR